MAGSLVVRPDKNEFLLYSMLNALGLAKGNPDSHFLRRQAVDHFNGYKGIGLKERDYNHHSKPVSYVLTINEPPSLSVKSNLKLEEIEEDECNIGSVVLPHLKHFYENTDFEDFYQRILPVYELECNFLQGVLERADIKGILERVWEVNEPLEMAVIPMPLEGFSSGIGPSVNDISYSIVGPPFDYSTPRLVAHETSHSIAKKILKPIRSEIESRKDLLDLVLKNPNYPKTYHHWQTCFEEHFIRAMQIGFINPELKWDIKVEEALKVQEKKGMIFIGDFYEELKRHKQNPEKKDLSRVVNGILSRLDGY